MSIDEMHWFPSNLKKHSELETQRIVDSILNDGFLFPIAIGCINDKNYIIDGECTYNALQQLKYEGYEIPEIPIYYVKCNEETIRKIILIATSTNHCVTKASLKKFTQDEKLLKGLGFNEGTLIDFIDVEDIDRCFEIVNHNISKESISVYTDSIKGGLL